MIFVAVLTGFTAPFISVLAFTIAASWVITPLEICVAISNNSPLITVPVLASSSIAMPWFWVMALSHSLRTAATEIMATAKSGLSLRYAEMSVS